MDIASAPAAKQSSSPQQQQSADWKLEVPVPFIAAGISIAGALVVAFLVHKWNGHRESRSRRVVAATRFRDAFAPDLAIIEDGSDTGMALMDQLRIAYNERHAPAVAVFEHFVKPGRLSSFRADWDRYRYGEREDKAPASPENTELSHEDLIMLCYCGSGDSWETHINMSASKKAAQRIRRLMSYASET